MKHLVLQLFVSGHSLRSRAAIAQALNIQARYPAGACELEVIDVVEQADRAEAQHILATPTLIKLAPLPVLRIIGDINDLERVLMILDPPAALGRPM